MAKVERSFTNAELVNGKPSAIGYWPMRKGRVRRRAAGSSMQGKAGLRKLAKLGIR